VSLASWFQKVFSRRPRGPQVALGRNDLCWCGSGKKYKRCHLKSDEIKRAEANYGAQLSARNRMGDGIVPGKAKPRKLEKTAAPVEKQ
jgi:hypothetical protein